MLCVMQVEQVTYLVICGPCAFTANYVKCTAAKKLLMVMQFGVCYSCNIVPILRY